MLRWRLLLGTLLAAAVVATVWLDARSSLAGAWLMPWAFVAVFLGGQEALELVAPAGARITGWPVHLGNTLIVLAAWLPAALAWPEGPYVLAAMFAAVWLLFIVAVRQYEAGGQNASRLAAAVLTVVYLGFMLAAAVQLRMRFGVAALASLVVIVKMADIGAYTVGRLIGRHKMAPRLSPGKTIEGAAGAMVFAVLGAWIVLFLSGRVVVSAEALGRWAAYGLIVGAAGVFGDLAESYIKRGAGMKDSSRWLPGFGGVLDIVDSVLLAAPVAWLGWQFGLV